MRYQSRLLMLVCLTGLLAFVLPRPVPLAQATPVLQAHATAPTASSDLVPLPNSCGGGLPPGAGAPVCCMFGYVFIDGQAVAGARVMITSSHGTVEEWTDYGSDSPQPYYRTSLSDLPLSAQAGDTITIVVEYSSHRRTITHQVLGGGQQVDVVLPRTQTNDYVFDRQISRQAEAGKFDFPSGIAVDRAGTVYVIDRDNARVQVFNSDGQFLRILSIIAG